MKKNSTKEFSLAVLDDEKIYGELTLSDIKNSNINYSQKEIILAKYAEKQIKYLDANFAGKKLQTIINLTIFESGFKVDNISEIILMVVKDIFSDFSFMTLTEISLAFRKGVRGELGDFMGLSIRTFYNWLKKYNDYKSDSIKQLQYIHKEEPVTEKKIKDAKKSWLKAFIDDFNNYKENNISEIHDFKNMFFDYCIENNIGYITENEKKIIREKAKNKILNTYSLKNASSIGQINDFRNIIKNISNETKDKNSNELLIMECKRLSIPYIYQKLIKNGIELKDVIEYIEKETF